ncbi:hypothetical protein [uncultured Agrobacterium sp.]|uniref:hypothetical protein n=1 Tax=uncultured Agrobacterium sp. TaxID=157277 RepID=UPI0025E71CA4|nr:hypothetical protein [uncultured Agrobacterium sp.]
MFIYFIRFFVFLSLLPTAAFASECPSAKNQKNGFVLSHSGVRSTFKLLGQVVSVDHEFSDGGKQNAFLYQGLIELSRSTKDGGYSQYFTSALDTFWPLKVGARRNFEFIPLDVNSEDGKWTLDLTVTKRSTVSLGDCTYDALNITYDVKRNGDEVERWTAVYAPDLRATIAKIYDEGTNKEEVVSYKAIKPLN